MEPFITIDETAELTGLSREHLAQLRYRQTGPKWYAPTPRTIRYRRSEVLAWIEQSARSTTHVPA